MWDTMQLFIGIVLIPPALIAGAAALIVLALVIAIHAVGLTVDETAP